MGWRTERGPGGERLKLVIIGDNWLNWLHGFFLFGAFAEPDHFTYFFRVQPIRLPVQPVEVRRW